MKKERVLICGGRDFKDAAFVTKTLDNLRSFFADTVCVITGGARGADELGKQWATDNGIPVLTIEANWDFYGNAAGRLRNQWMLAHCKPDVVIAFPGHRGTADMVEQAHAAGVTIHEPVYFGEYSAK